MNLRRLGYFLGSFCFILMSFFTLTAPSEETTSITVKGFNIGLPFAILSLLLGILLNIKWNEEARESLIKSTEYTQTFLKAIPLSFIGNLYLLWLLLMMLPTLDPIISMFVLLPLPLIHILSGMGMIFFILSTFIVIGNAKFSQVALGSMIFAISQLFGGVTTAFTTKQLVVENMVNFIVFWTLYAIFSVYSKDTAPVEKEKKPKKDKKKSKKKGKEDVEDELIEENNAKAVDAYIEKQKEKEETSEK